MSAANKSFRVAQVLLTLGVFEFFGPILRDASATHLWNPAWVGHARFHLAWALVFMALSGLSNLYLIWGKHSLGTKGLYVAWLWQACNVFGFWGAVALEPRYGGAIVDPEFHVKILGLNENLFVFVVLGVLLAGTLVYMKTRVEPLP